MKSQNHNNVCTISYSTARTFQYLIEKNYLDMFSVVQELTTVLSKENSLPDCNQSQLWKLAETTILELIRNVRNLKSEEVEIPDNCSHINFLSDGFEKLSPETLIEV